MRCTKCVLGASCSGVIDIEPASSKIMFLGLSPGKEEDRTSRPFSGKVGHWVREIVDLDVLYMYTVLCRPPEDRLPEENEQYMCFGHIQRAILYHGITDVILAGCHVRLAVRTYYISDPGKAMHSDADKRRWEVQMKGILDEIRNNSGVQRDENR